MKRIILFDDYNQRIPKDQDCIGTITCNVGNSAPRNGFKIIEMEDAIQDVSISKRNE